MRGPSPLRVAVAGLWLGACGGAPAPTPATPPGDADAPDAGATAPMAPDALEGALVIGRGEGADADAATAAALVDLERALLGDGEAWVTGGWVEAPLWVPALDLRHEARGDGAVVVALGLREDRVRGLLAPDGALVGAAFRPGGQDGPAGPAVLRGRVTEAYRQAMTALACARRAALGVGEGGCPARGSPERGPDEPDALEALLADVTLRAYWEGGVPLDVDGRPRRPIVLHGVSPRPRGEPGPAARPLEDLPVELVHAGTAARLATATTDAAGLAPIPWPDGVDPDAGAHAGEASWRVPLLARVDLGRWLGPLARRGAAPGLAVEVRRTGLPRRVVAARVRARGRRADGAAFAEALDRALVERGLPPAFSPGRADRRPLLEALDRPAPPARVDALPDLTDRHRGAIDVALLVRIESAFASRMGPQRVWYEATATVDRYDAWTGALVDRVSAAATASGLGDADADAAARAGLARALADALLAGRPF